MSQSRCMSLIEATSNVALGCAVALATQLLAFPIVGVQASLTQHLWLTTVFTGVSVIRSYLVRRFFNRLLRETA